MVHFLDLPLEVRRMVYRQLLVIDHNSNNWGWELDRIGALNKRHKITWVSSQIRKEAQQVFYTSITWQTRLLYSGKGHVRIGEKVLRLLFSLEGWNQTCNIQNVRLSFDIDCPPFRGHNHPDSDRRQKRPRRILMTELLAFLPQLRHVEMSWVDSARTIPWAQKERDLLQPFRGIRTLRSCLINLVGTAGQDDGIRGFTKSSDFAERVKQATAIPNVHLDSHAIQCRYF